MLGSKFDVTVILEHFRTDLTPLFVCVEFLRFEDEDAVLIELLEDSFEHKLDAIIAVVEMYPLCD